MVQFNYTVLTYNNYYLIITYMVLDLCCRAVDLLSPVLDVLIRLATDVLNVANAFCSSSI